jgi:hypothetical protein
MKAPSRAEVIALAALVVAMSGTSYAAVRLGQGSVTSREIRDGEVKARELGDEAVTARAIASGLVWPGQLAENSVGAGSIAPDSVTWDRMSSKVRSDLASLVLWRVFRQEKSRRVTTANQDWELSVDCGTARLLGGGFDVPPGVAVLRSVISRDAKTWIVAGRTGAQSADVSVYATCLQP